MLRAAAYLGRNRSLSGYLGYAVYGLANIGTIKAYKQLLT